MVKKGNIISPETRAKMRLAKLGTKWTPEHIAKVKSFYADHPEKRPKISDATRMALKEFWANRDKSQYERDRRSKLAKDKYANDAEFRSQITGGRLGTVATPEQLRKLKIYWDEHKQERVGEGNPAWLGGITNSPYDHSIFNNALRERIRARDNYTCQMCGKVQMPHMKLAVHHIDYNKLNCSGDNLISLCSSSPNTRCCHAKTNVNRKYWEKRFKQLIKTKQMVMRI